MLLIHADIHSMDGHDYADGYIRTDGSKIEALGDMKELASIPADALDLKGATVLPGFIDAHCHIGVCDDSLREEGDDCNDANDPTTPQLSAVDAVDFLDVCFREAVDAGVTSVLTGPGSANPIGGQWLAMKTYGSTMDDMCFKAPAGMKFALGENPKTCYHGKGRAPSTRMATASIIRIAFEKTKRYMEDLEKAEKDPKASKPAYDEKCEALIPVLKGEVRAFFHAHRADDILTAVRLGKEYNLDYVVVHCTEGHRIADTLAKEHVRAIVGPILTDRSKPELRHQTPANAGRLLAAGVAPAICTDHPVIPIQYLPISAAVCVKMGLPYEDAIKGLTIRAAELAGISDRVGSITPGKDADLIVFPIGMNPLEAMSSPSHVIINGELVKGA